MTLPTLHLVLPRLRYGGIVIVDNSIASAKRYADLLGFLRNPSNGFTNLTLPYSKGLEMSVYLPKTPA
jgi:predicted O-methyltransferase YrrM